MEPTDVLKVDQVPKTYVLLEKYYNTVEKNLRTGERDILRAIGDYRDRNIRILSNPYPYKYPIFSNEDRNILHRTLKIQEKELEEDIAKVKDSFPKNFNRCWLFKPFQTLMLFLIKHYLEKGNEAILDMLYRYLGYSMYFAAYVRYFKFFNPKEEVIMYMINNMSNKYTLKQEGSVDNYIRKVIVSCIRAYKKRILDGSDVNLDYVIDGMWTRMNNSMKAIFANFKEVYDQKLTIFKSTEFAEDAEGEVFNREHDTVSNNVEQLAQTYTSKFFRGKPSAKLIHLSSEMSHVNELEVKTSLDLLLNGDEINEVRDFYRCLFYLYFEGDMSRSRDSVKSFNFVAAMRTIYKTGNSTDKNLKRMKYLLNKWLKSGSSVYRTTTRLPTINNYRNALYNYFILAVASNG